MKQAASIMAVHLVRMGAMTTLIITCMFLPFLPGGYDGLAVTLFGWRYAPPVEFGHL
jgi:hypothetical protein